MITRVLLYLLILVAGLTQAETIDVKVNCIDVKNCSEFKKRYVKIFSDIGGRDELDSKVKFVLNDDKVSFVNYVLDHNGLEGVVFIKPKRKISKIEFESGKKVNTKPLEYLLPIKTNQYFSSKDLEVSKEKIRTYLIESGYSYVSVESTLEKYDFEVDIKFLITTKVLDKLDFVEVLVDHPPYKKNIYEDLRKLQDESWNKAEVNMVIEKIRNDLFFDGFYYAKLDTSKTEKKGRSVLVVKVSLGIRTHFDFRGNLIFSRQELTEYLEQKIREDSKDLSPEKLEEIVQERYEKVGIYNTIVDVRTREGVSSSKIPFKNFYLEIQEGKKKKVESVVFNGVAKALESDLTDLMEGHESVLSSRGFFDEKFYFSFKEKIKEYYLSRGFIFFEISDPVFEYVDKESVRVIYDLVEKNQNSVKVIKIEGVEESFSEEIKKTLINKRGSPLNVLEIENDLKRATAYLKGKGYFFAKIVNARGRDIVRYSPTYEHSYIVMKFNTGHKSIFENYLVTGNSKTNNEIIEREIKFKKGEIVTSKQLGELNQKLVNLGLFSSVTITPYINKVNNKKKLNYINLLIKLKEKEFGTGEFPIGYRTDLGPKIGVRIKYNNLWGDNHSITTNIEANQRLNSTGFDGRRKSEDKRFPEGALEFNYRWPYLFHKFLNSQVDMDVTTSFKRKRFFSFDGDIMKVTPRLSKDFTDWLSGFVKYQFEDIRQFDASEEKDNDRFQIGSITPALNFNFRDNDVAPRKGYFLGVSWEFANPFFLSQDKESLEINYSKLILRNKFYIPIFDWTLAISVSGGFEKNYANDIVVDSNGGTSTNSDGSKVTKGYIPSIKVFRLNGIDSVRGFSDSEINRLESGEDIGEVRLQSEAYFMNYKIEPRYYISDNFAVNVFFDAGFLGVGHFKPTKVRTSIGAGFKFLTPVGSLDFDYGIKLDRKTYSGSVKEGFGRFHLSIGSF